MTNKRKTEILKKNKDMTKTNSGIAGQDMSIGPRQLSPEGLLENSQPGKLPPKEKKITP